ncbi:YibE/F family protein [Leucobacter triazinivorans]|uniref:YibE/F family protein n=2 Tax=Leucobacter triazinivorans TaxID=1784719 RepID=A0A4P6KG11_9MICO|nr:YibE/F family protein [Leucobacter triazinivorans]
MGVFRGWQLLVLVLVFAAVVVAVGRWRGLLALAALGVAAWVLLAFVLPALVAGGPGLLVGVVGSSAIMFATLYFVHGPNLRTTAALVGTLCGILIMAGISLIAVQATRLSGVGDEASGQLAGLASQIDFRGLLSCAIIIAGLGVLNDVTITQASAVWELRAAAPAMSRREVYARAMRIGRDHIASTVYTVFFAYVGAAMSVLILLYLYDRPMLSLLTHEDIVTEIVRTLCGSVGLVLAVPITTWVAALLLPPADHRSALPDHRSALPDHRSALPDHRSALPDHRSALPDHRSALPE